jgi:pSer/pThr/pTyr-binding forkhead associated (FHA) protein
VNGVPLADAHSLRDGDRVVVGRTELVFRSSVLGRTASAADVVLSLPRLELRSGPGMGLSFVLSSGACTIGSGASADFQVFEPSVAAEHARVRAAQGVHYLSDLGSPSGTFVRAARLPPGSELPLTDGEVFQIGSVVGIAYTRAPTRDRVAAFRPLAKLDVVSGAGAGQRATFEERALVGNAEGAHLRVPGAPYELELVAHQGAFFARDLSGGRTFRSGVPLGPEWAPLRNGDLLLLSSGALLRFEEP